MLSSQALKFLLEFSWSFYRFKFIITKCSCISREEFCTHRRPRDLMQSAIGNLLYAPNSTILQSKFEQKLGFCEGIAGTSRIRRNLGLKWRTCKQELDLLREGRILRLKVRGFWERWLHEAEEGSKAGEVPVGCCSCVSRVQWIPQFHDHWVHQKLQQTSESLSPTMILSPFSAIWGHLHMDLIASCRLWKIWLITKMWQDWR